MWDNQHHRSPLVGKDLPWSLVHLELVLRHYGEVSNIEGSRNTIISRQLNLVGVVDAFQHVKGLFARGENLEWALLGN